MSAHSAPAGVRAIILYKTVKGALALAGGATLIVIAISGHAEIVHDFATWVRHHLAAEWSKKAIDLLVEHTTPRTVAFTGGALVLDGAVTSVEGWALRRGRAWGKWLVVVATGAFLPFEVYEIARHVHVLRVVAFVLNVAIVVYLARRARHER